jgi:hypothetical protein
MSSHILTPSEKLFDKIPDDVAQLIVPFIGTQKELIRSGIAYLSRRFYLLLRYDSIIQRHFCSSDMCGGKTIREMGEFRREVMNWSENQIHSLDFDFFSTDKVVDRADFPSSSPVFYQFIGQTKSLHNLTLCGVRFEPDHIRLLADSLRENTSIHTFTIEKTGFLKTKDGTFDHIYNGLNRDVLPFLMEGIKDNRSIHKISLDIQSDISRLFDIRLVTDMLRANTTLKTITLRWSYMAAEQIGGLFEFLQTKTNTSVTSLELIAGLGMERECIPGIFKHLPDTNIQTLKLKTEMWNMPLIGEKAQIFADSMERNTVLQHLHMVGRDVDSSFQTIARAMWANTTLQTLEWSNTNLHRGNIISHFSELLQGNTTLKTLILCNDSLNNDDFETLAHGLRQNTTLTELSLSQNSLRKFQTVFDLLDGNRGLRRIDLTCKDLDTKMPRKLEKAMSRNGVVGIIKLKSGEVRPRDDDVDGNPKETKRPTRR